MHSCRLALFRMLILACLLLTGWFGFGVTTGGSSHAADVGLGLSGIEETGLAQTTNPSTMYDRQGVAPVATVTSGEAPRPIPTPTPTLVAGSASVTWITPDLDGVVRLGADKHSVLLTGQEEVAGLSAACAGGVLTPMDFGRGVYGKQRTYTTPDCWISWISISGTQPWISVSPASLYIAENSSGSLAVYVDRYGLAETIHQGQVLLQGSPASSMAVSMEVPRYVEESGPQFEDVDGPSWFTVSRVFNQIAIPFRWRIESVPSWVSSYTPAIGTPIPPGTGSQEVSVSIRVDPSGLESGVYVDTLVWDTTAGRIVTPMALLIRKPDFQVTAVTLPAGELQTTTDYEILVRFANVGGDYHPQAGIVDTKLIMQAPNGDEWVWAFRETLGVMRRNEEKQVRFYNILFPSHEITTLIARLEFHDPELNPANNEMTRAVSVTRSLGWRSCAALPAQTFLLWANLQSGGQASTLLKFPKMMASIYSVMVGCVNPDWTCVGSVASFTFGLFLENFPGIAAIKDALLLIRNDVLCAQYLANLWGAATEAQARRGGTLNAVSSQSPGNITVVDSQGRRSGYGASGVPVNQIPNAEVGSRNGYQVVVYPGTDISSIQLESSAQGTCTIPVSLADRQGDRDIEVTTLVYRDIYVTGSTTGQINVSGTQSATALGSQYVLRLDDNQDGVPDRLIEPSEETHIVVKTSSTFLPMLVRGLTQNTSGTPTRTRTQTATPTFARTPTRTHTAAYTLTRTPTPSGTLTPGLAWREEAEDGQVESPMTIGQDVGASGTRYVYSPQGNLDPPGVGRATFSFSVPTAKTYYLWERVMALGWNNNSYYISLDGGEWVHHEILEVNVPWLTWGWNRVKLFQDLVGLPLQAGAHTLSFAGREANVRLDALILTDDPNYQPEGILQPASNR